MLNEIHGFLFDLPCYGACGVSLAALLFLGYLGAPLWLWSVAVVAGLIGVAAPWWLIAIVGIGAVILNLPPLRRVLITGPLMSALKSWGSQ